MNIRSTLVCVGVMVLAHAGTTIIAQQPPSRSSPPYQNQSQVMTPRTNERQIQQILTRLRTDAEALRQSADVTAPRGRAGNRGWQSRNDVSYLIDDLLEAADHLSDHLVRRQVIRPDLDDLFRRGVLIESALEREGSVPDSQAAWNRVRRDLDDLATGYGMSSSWHNTDYVPARYSGGVYDRFTGTYALDPSRSDNPRQAADRALAQVPAAQRNRISNQVYARIEAPEVISIDRTGNQVTIASSRAPQMTFDADGQPHTERTYGSGAMTTRANVYGDRLEVSTSGGAGTDYQATFEPLDNGQSMRLTRRIYDAALRQPIVVQSVYRRTSETAEWNVYDARPNPGTYNDRTSTNRDESTAVYRGNRANAALVPDGTILVATLDQDVSTRVARQNDRVTLTVKNAARPELEGATIQGYLVGAPSASNGRTGVSIDFNEIRLRNGRTADFAGVVQSVRGANGRQVVFDADQQADPNADRDAAIQRGAIGATVGAIIGAIAGGGKGAAIGAVLGGGGAAATVYMDQGQASLPRGTEFTIQSRTPRP